MSPSQSTSAVRSLSADPSAAHAGAEPFNAGGSALQSPSSFYRPVFWRIGLLLARYLPYWFSVGAARAAAWIYVHLRPRRRGIVVQNLLPALEGDRAAAERTSLRLFQNFAVKLADLWRYENGQSISDLFGEFTGWEHLTAVRASGRGVLLLTAHLGNWEFGAPVLARQGIRPVVITLDEPHQSLTELRQASRARWNIETIVIGRDTFAIVEVIRRLEAGATVALLVDRPPAASATQVRLFGKPFSVSIAAAELARAAGCALLPVCLPQTGRGYAARILPEVPYDRASLRAPEARQRLNQEIVNLFEPLIRQHLDQWYHFVPIWPG